MSPDDTKDAEYPLPKTTGYKRRRPNRHKDISPCLPPYGLAEPADYTRRKPLNWRKPGGKLGREHTLGDEHLEPEEAFPVLSNNRDPDRHVREATEPTTLDFELLEALGVLPPEKDLYPLTIEEFEMKVQTSKALPPGYKRIETGEVIPSLDPRPPEEQQKTKHLEINIKGETFPELTKSLVETLDALASSHPDATPSQQHAISDGRVNPKVMFALLHQWVHSHGGKLNITLRVPLGRPVNVTVDDLLELRRREAEANLTLSRDPSHSKTRISVKGKGV
jgi:hypothetical protein